MEYYQVRIVYKGQKVGVGYNPKRGIVWIGGFSKVLKHITLIAFKCLKLQDEKILDKSGTRQKNRFRYYAKISDKEFRQGLALIARRYSIYPCKEGIFKFT
jgi:hypothetical protein